MKMLATYLTLIISVSLLQGQPYNELPEKVTITGRVLNFENYPDVDVVTVYINDPGRSTQLSFADQLDESGSFEIIFDRYLPQDVMIKYRTNFRVLVHPGDSLHVIFDADHIQREELFQHVQFSGDAAKQNQELAIYLQDYYVHRYDFRTDSRNQTRLNPEEYAAVWDSISYLTKQRRQQFIKKYRPSEEIIRWTLYDVAMERINNLLKYPLSYRRFNKLTPVDWALEDAYFKFLDDMPPVNKGSLINTAVSTVLVNYYRFGYVYEKSIQDRLKASRQNPIKTKNKAPNYDSTNIYSIVRYAQHGDLLRSLTLNEYINQSLEKQRIEVFENYEALINEIIQEPFLVKPLQPHYQEVKLFFDNPQISKQAVLENLSDVDNRALLGSIMEKNKNKLIYLDIWATWCGPCIREFPKAKELQEQLKEKGVSFVYLCIESEEEKWKATLSKFQLPGQHYLIDNKQSAYIRNDYKIAGIPHYILFDQEGAIIASGSHLRPSGRVIQELVDKHQ